MATQQNRNDWIEFQIQDHVWVQVYWRDDRAGYGPAASVYAYDQEILRLDCFGEAKKQGGTGHCHVNLKQTGANQWIYPPGSVRDHIGQAIHDLKQNLNFCLKTNTDDKVRTIELNPELVELVSRKVEKKMLVFAHLLELK